jgi:hypothetical protein
MPRILSWFAIYGLILFFFIVTDEPTTSPNPVDSSARYLLIWRVVSILLFILIYIISTQQTIQAASELFLQSQSGIFPTWRRKVGPPLDQSSVYSEVLGKTVSIDSEPHVLLVISQYWDEKCQRFVHQACLSGVNVVVLVHSKEIALQVKTANSRLVEDNLLGLSAALYIVIDDENTRHKWLDEANNIIAKSSCYFLCISYLMRQQNRGNNTFVLDRCGRICSVSSPGQFTNVMRCSSSSRINQVSQVLDEVKYVEHLKNVTVEDRRLSNEISYAERTCGLCILLLLVCFFVLHSLTSFYGFCVLYRYVAPHQQAASIAAKGLQGGGVTNESLALNLNSTVIQDHGLWLAASADAFVGCLVGVLPIALLLAAATLGLIFWVGLIFIQCICSNLLHWVDPCIDSCIEQKKVRG